jgi:hypothetical protein
MSSKTSTNREQPVQAIRQEYERINLNEVMQQELLRAQGQDSRSRMIVRCENLPVVEGAPAVVSGLLRGLVSLITAHPPLSSRLFLYIDCEEENKEVEAALTQGYKRYRIDFHTNALTGEKWHMANQEKLEAYKKMALAFNGTLEVNQIGNTGCLFSISLVGKI